MGWQVEEQVRRLLKDHGYEYENGALIYDKPEGVPWRDCQGISNFGVLTGLAAKLKVQVETRELPDEGIKRKVGMIYHDRVTIFAYMLPTQTA